MTGRILAHLILESDDDLDAESELKRLSGTTHPGVEIESEANHWNVYRMALGTRRLQGAVYYSDPNDVPPEAAAHWREISWSAIPLFSSIQAQFFKTFDEAVSFLADIKWLGENDEDQPEPDLDPAQEVQRYTEIPRLIVKNPESREKWGGKEFMVELTWDGSDRVGEQRIQPMLTFYDRDEVEEGNEKGQKVARYYASSIASHVKNASLSLNGSVAAWWIDAAGVNEIKDWLRQELEKKRRYKLIQNWPFDRYESLEDPDNPEAYTNPERVSKQPKVALLETAFREMLKPYYDQIDVRKTEGTYFGALSDYAIWRINCKRAKQLPLANRYQSLYLYREAVDWRKQIEEWFRGIATRHDVMLRDFSVYGRLRKDPTFCFDTYRWKTGGVAESVDDPESPEAFVQRMVTTPEAIELQAALWKFHPYGVGYSVTGNTKQLSVNVWTYFELERRDAFAEEVKNFAVKWVNDNHFLRIESVQMTKWDAGRAGQTPYNGFTVWFNIPFDVNKIAGGDDEAA